MELGCLVIIAIVVIASAIALAPFVLPLLGWSLVVLVVVGVIKITLDDWRSSRDARDLATRYKGLERKLGVVASLDSGSGLGYVVLPPGQTPPDENAYLFRVSDIKDVKIEKYEDHFAILDPGDLVEFSPLLEGRCWTAVAMKQVTPDPYSAESRPPYPTTYGFKLPSKGQMQLACGVSEQKDAAGQATRQHATAMFSNENPLVFTHGYRVHPGEPFLISIDSRPRHTSRRGRLEQLPSDITSLLRALGSGTSPEEQDPAVLVAALVEQGGKEFLAEIEWTASCNEAGPVYLQNPWGALCRGVNEDGTPRRGCGAAYEGSDWPHGRRRRTCSCGASLAPVAQLKNFRAR